MIDMDWADEIVRVLAGPEASDDDFLMSLSQVATALRKAKADGMEAAAKIASEWGVTILQFPAENLQEHVEQMMNDIGPNISEAILTASKLDSPTE